MLGSEQLRSIVSSGIALTQQQDKNRLYELLIRTAMDISRCDAGTLYLYHDGKLYFKIMKTLSLRISRGENGDEIDLPPVPLEEGSVCAYAAIHQELVNIPDVYNSEMFDFSGPRHYDAITGYRTESMLVIPLADSEHNLVGVLQLINAQNPENGQVTAFNSDDEFVITSLGSIAAVSILNALYIDQINDQLHSFVDAFATAVDERTPYNGNHTRKVTVYTGILADMVQKKYEAHECERGYSQKQREELVMAAALHDIGKMIVPLSVMNKATRLDGGLERIRERFEYLEALYELEFCRHRMTEEEKTLAEAYLRESLDFLKEADTAGFLDDGKLARVREIGAHSFLKENGEKIPYLTPYELECLTIRKGTLTDDERKTIESHALMTRQILNRVHFSRDYSNVTRIASSHHELLNGRGYPDHLTGEALDMDIRILTVADIFDALTSTDRPYKQPIPRPKAFAILRSMVEEGKLEGRLVDWLEEALQDYPEERIREMAAGMWVR